MGTRNCSEARESARNGGGGRRSMAILLAAALVGCTGTVLDPGVDPTVDGPGGRNPSYRCDPAAAAVPSGMRRLTRDQFDNTLRDLLGAYLGEARAEAVLAASGPQHTLLPADVAPTRRDSRFSSDYRRWDQTVSELHIDGWYDTALAISGTLAAEDRAALLGQGCTGGECVRTFLREFASRAFRHPVHAETLARIERAYGDTSTISAAGLRDAIGFMLLAPDFIYHVEEGSESAPQALSSYEIASRLSYALWDTLPDEVLWQAAADDALAGHPDEIERQAARMLADPRARPVIARFFEDWFQLARTADFTTLVGTPAYDAFAGDDLPSAGLRDEAIDEIRALTTYLTLEANAPITELVTTNLAPVRGAELARLYRMGQPWDGNGEPPRFGDGRDGILTRLALVGSAGLTTRPVRKGVFIREDLLCDHIGDPPPGAEMSTIELEGLYSTRDYYEALTEVSGTTCVGCHATMINALGFVTENYDSLGRLRDVESVFDRQTGELLGTVPLNLEVAPRIWDDGSTVSSAAELGALIVESGKLEYCAARHAFRFMAARHEDDAADGCALERAREAAASGSIRDMIVALLTSDAMLTRVYE